MTHEPVAHCSLCPRVYAGRCARCDRAICAFCCILTGDAITLVLCLPCAERDPTIVLGGR